jgi:predicted ATP-dependent Lon-type protease
VGEGGEKTFTAGSGPSARAAGGIAEVTIAELVVEKGAEIVLFPVSARRQLNDLSDDMAARVMIVFYVDARDALLKAIAD